MCAKVFKQMLSAARLTVAHLGPARQRERAKKREKRTLAYLQQFDNCHDVAVALIMALNSGSLCCELAVCEFLCAHKSMQQFFSRFACEYI